MDRSVQRAKAESFRALHAGPGLLVLPNAWDVASARIFARSPSCRALGTTSSGIAAVLGYPDGEVAPREQMLEMVSRIVRAVEVPVSADVEAGYGTSAEAAAETAAEVISAGAVGLNLEDACHRGEEPLLSLERQAERIRAIRELGERAGVPLFINARTDVYSRQVGEPDDLFAEAVRRSNAYRAAGADCLFVLGVMDGETIGRLVEALDGPLNVFAYPELPPLAELERLGVRRLSIGPQAQRAGFALTARIAEELLEKRELGFLSETPTRTEVERLLTE
ncbi:MAG: isocitrate lyase/phosphoenolpyruvate mutase family protein [Gaiellaceae bacterium]|jgi:2-methylisocitrate lyase-like PEP mutase family enzyme